MLNRIILITIVLLAAMPEAGAESSRLHVRIGVGDAYPPFYHLDRNGTLRGFEIDLAQALCEKANLDCTFVVQNWNQLIPALLAGRFDTIMASLAITEKRRRHVIFSNKYYSSPITTVTRREDDLHDGMLAGRRIGVQRNTVHHRYVEQRLVPVGATAHVHATLTEGMIALKAGQVDAVIADKIWLMNWLQSSPYALCCKLMGQDLSDPDLFGEGMGLAFRPADGELRDRFNQAIETVLKDGTYRRINDRYFPFDAY